MSKAILYDSTLCIGCKSCEGACAERWHLPYDDKVAAEPRLSAHKLTAIQTFGEHYSRRRASAISASRSPHFVAPVGQASAQAVCLPARCRS